MPDTSERIIDGLNEEIEELKEQIEELEKDKALAISEKETAEEELSDLKKKVERARYNINSEMDSLD